MKKWGFVFVTLIMVLLTACGNNSEAGNKEKVLRYQNLTGQVLFPELAADLGYLDGIKLEIVGDYKGGPEAIQLVASNQMEFGWAFNAALARAEAKDINVTSVISAMGSDQYTYVGAYTLEYSEIQSAKDLIGKQIGVNTLGAQYEFTIMNYLREGGLTEEEIAEVALVTVPVAGAEQALRNNQVDVVLLAGVSRDLALERGGLTEIFRDIDIFGGDTITANYFFSDKFIEQNPETVKTFVEGVAKAIEWAKATPVEEVKTRFEDIIKKRNPNETTDNLKFWQGTGIGSEGGVIKDSDYSIWIEQLVNSGELKEGQVTPSDLYTNKYNSFAK